MPQPTQSPALNINIKYNRYIILGPKIVFETWEPQTKTTVKVSDIIGLDYRGHLTYAIDNPSWTPAYLVKINSVLEYIITDGETFCWGADSDKAGNPNHIIPTPSLPLAAKQTILDAIKQYVGEL